MSSNITLNKECEWCHNEFIARTTTTSYCSNKCANRAYKDRVRRNRLNSIQANLISQKHTKATIDIRFKEYLTPTETSKNLGVSRASIYRYLADNRFPAVQFKGKTLIRKTDIDRLFDTPEAYKKRLLKPQSPITEFYTTAEIKEKYNVTESWIFTVAKRNSIPKTFSRGKTYWSKKHIDKYFAKKAPDPEITEWYTVQKIQEKFQMTLTAIYAIASKDGIPKKKEGKMVLYSKRHFDIAKGINTPEEPQFYMVIEAMNKFNLTRDQLYHYVKYHNIPRIKIGKYTKISKPELDNLFEYPKIE